MATERQAEIFRDEVLAPVGKEAVEGRNMKDNLTGFLAQEGRFYEHSDGLMVVGRAVNGFEHDIDPIDFNDSGYREEHANELLQMTCQRDDQPCPMEWVTTEKWKRGLPAFWRVVRGVTRGLGISNPESEDWPSHLVWSNLYKVSPAGGGNPNNSLCNAQYDGCKKLLQCEIQDYRPRHLLFLTESRNHPNWWARPFLDDLELRDWPDGRYVRFTGRLSFLGCSCDTLIVGAVHPQGQSGTRQEIADEILSAFEQK